jgi:Tfp pilus assembly protein FimT
MIKHHLGYSLLELIVILGLFSIIFSISFPTISSAAKKSTLSKFAQNTSTWLSSLRQKTINYQIPIEVKKESNLITANPDNPNNKKILKTSIKNIPENINVSISGNSIRFNISGSQTPASIIFKDKKNTCYLKLSLRGRNTVICD